MTALEEKMGLANGRVPVAEDFRLRLASDDFEWAGERRPGLPLLHWPDGRLCLPATIYFGYSVEIARGKISSMKGEAYILREWFAFLASRRREWNQPADDLLRKFRANQKARRAPRGSGAGAVPPSKRRRGRPLTGARIERKINVVFSFYDLLPKAIGFAEDLTPYPKFVSDDKGRTALTSKSVTTAEGDLLRRWVGAEPVDESPALRPVPSMKGVQNILACLRTRKEHAPSRRPTVWASEESKLLQERNWLVGLLPARAGLRGDEVANFSLDQLLTSFGALPKRFTASGFEGHLLDYAADDPELRTYLIDRLRGKSDLTLKRHPIPIRGKGRGTDGKLRAAPFPIVVVEQLLEIGVWTVRKRQIAEWRRRDPLYVPPDNVFLSHKTKRGMSAGSVGDIVKDAFKVVGEDGSGHRLRAYYAVDLARDLFREQIDLNGGKLDESVRDIVLFRVADALGHSDWRTSVAHYVAFAQIEVEAAPHPASLRREIDSLLDLVIDPANEGRDIIGLLRKVLDKLRSPKTDPLFTQFLKRLIADFGG